MKILKSYLRSRLTEKNMQWLAMAYIHTYSYIVIVIDHFALKNKRLQHVLTTASNRWPEDGIEN